MKKEVVIVGGGLAGLVAAVELVSRGHHVIVIESKGHLGGRAYSYREPILGTTLDNGQHIVMGCYKGTLDFFEKIGTLDRVDFQKNLGVDFAGLTRDFIPTGIKSLRAWPLPNPFHLAFAFLFFSGLSWKDKWALRHVIKAVKDYQKNPEKEHSRLDKKTVSDWLSELKQPKQVQERFWDILNYAALNDQPQKSSAALFAKVLEEALFSGKSAARIGVPKVGLSDLYVEAARDFIERKGGHFLLKTRVHKLHFQHQEVNEIELEGGRRLAVENLLVTVPFTALKKMLPEQILYHEKFFHPLHELQSSPIVSVHFWFDQEVMEQPFVGLWGTKVHWVFRKSGMNASGYPHVTLVISGGREELKMPGPDLIKMALDELMSIFPKVREAKLVHSMVSKETEATLAPAPGVESLRLPQKTPYRNFYLAGDWTDTGLPATIESAVRSANVAAEWILNNQ